MTQAPEAPAEPAAARPTLLLVDGSSYLYRAFHAMPDLRADPGDPAGVTIVRISTAEQLADEMTKRAADADAVIMAAAVADFRPVTVNDTKTYNNGVKVIPSYLLQPVAVDKSNWEQILVGSGYYTKDQVE